MSALIETYKLCKKYPVLKSYRDVILHPFKRKEKSALRGVTLQVQKGEIFGLLGPNGAGKTTLLKILSTLVLPGSGDARVMGMDVRNSGRSIRKVTGYVISEERSFYWRLTGRQNLTFFAHLNNLSGKESEQRIRRLLDLMNLTAHADRMFKDYSAGMRQKLAIARGLLTDPDIIYMDESTNGLDPVSAFQLKSFVREKLVDKEGKTVIFATHNLQDAEDICDRIAIIQDGQVRLTGTMEDIRRNHGTEKTYIIRARDLEKSIVKKIKGMDLVKKAVNLSNGSSDALDLQVEIAQSNGNINSLIKEITASGGELVSLYEKKPSLGELFTEIVKT